MCDFWIVVQPYLQFIIGIICCITCTVVAIVMIIVGVYKTIEQSNGRTISTVIIDWILSLLALLFVVGFYIAVMIKLINDLKAIEFV